MRFCMKCAISCGSHAGRLFRLGLAHDSWAMHHFVFCSKFELLTSYCFLFGFSCCFIPWPAVKGTQL